MEHEGRITGLGQYLLVSPDPKGKRTVSCLPHDSRTVAEGLADQSQPSIQTYISMLTLERAGLESNTVNSASERTDLKRLQRTRDVRDHFGRPEGRPPLGHLPDDVAQNPVLLCRRHVRALVVPFYHRL